jgi:hypothetical protein
MLSFKEMAVVLIIHAGGLLLATSVLLGGGEGLRLQTGAPYAASGHDGWQPGLQLAASGPLGEIPGGL